MFAQQIWYVYVLAFVQTGVCTNTEFAQIVRTCMGAFTLKGRWCDIIVLNVHAPLEDKDDGIKDSFYEEIERLFRTPNVSHENPIR